MKGILIVLAIILGVITFIVWADSNTEACPHVYQAGAIKQLPVGIDENGKTITVPYCRICDKVLNKRKYDNR